MALLAYSSNSETIPDDTISYRCGGTVINHRYILTAAHCLVNTDYRLLGVRLGEHDLRTERDCQEVCAPPVQDIIAEEVIPHPQYRRPDKNDIGLIRLQRDIIFNQAVRPICLPIGRTQQLKSLDGQKVTVTGWGTTEFGTNSPILKKVDLPIVPISRCARIYNTSVQITAQHICAGGSQGKDSCAGDSGGPLQNLAQKAGELVYIQYGVVAFGPRHCGSWGMPGVYTRVGYYMEWILNNMRP
ncbi:UNVERIFIED_CONTAM: hypothetical protein PYX00_007822 [Menopon gallinae]|uniref:Peptidase S1 domain-containing protein n=1 Tax=Menopon gallinae TaxID=328185 RepID=A0AAW2HLE2_9NEOP